MIVNTTCTITHTTIADASAWYSVPFTYVTTLNVPQIIVTLGGTEISYGSDYTLGPSGLRLLQQPTAGRSLVITRNTPMTQPTDFQTGMIDPDEIEDGFDRAAMRDQELASKIDNVSAIKQKRPLWLMPQNWDIEYKTQEIYIPGLELDDDVLVSPVSYHYDEYVAAGIRCTGIAPADGGGYVLGFKCDTIPIFDIYVNIAILK